MSPDYSKQSQQADKLPTDIRSTWFIGGSEMQKQTPHKELYDPFSHYTRGVLYFDDDKFTFTAYRVPYQELDDKTWTSERAFNADYRRMIARKYAIVKF